MATAVDTLAMLGRHAKWPLLGAIEIVQVAVLIAGCGALILATADAVHARVHLLLNRLSPRWRASLERVHRWTGALFVVALFVGSAWLMLDLWQGHEESELLRLPYRPLRIVVVVATFVLFVLILRAVRPRSEVPKP